MLNKKHLVFFMIRGVSFISSCGLRHGNFLGSLPRLESQSSLKRIGTDQSRLHRSPSMFDKMFGFLLRSNA